MKSKKTVSVRGKKITTVEAIFKLANSGKSVYVASWKRKSSAAFLIAMPAAYLLRNVIPSGIYTK